MPISSSSSFLFQPLFCLPVTPTLNPELHSTLSFSEDPDTGPVNTSHTAARAGEKQRGREKEGVIYE